MAGNIEIDSVTGTGQRIVEVDLIRLPLINTPLQRGDLRSADPNCFNSFTPSTGGKPIKTVGTER